MHNNYVIGIDFGTDSVRTIVVDASNGSQIAESVYMYPRWAQGKYCDATQHQFRQHPLDYLEGLEHSLKEAVTRAGKDIAARIKGIAVDTTGSTPCAVDAQGMPLALHPEFADNPNAMFILWKDHTAIQEAREINALAHNGTFEDFTKYVGGIYSSEWYWAKILHTLRIDAQVRQAAHSWVEHCDWIPAVLTGNTNVNTLKRYRCSAGHKAMWNASLGGLPSEEFLTALDPLLSGVRKRLYQDTITADIPAGVISREWAQKLGLPDDVIIGGSAFDAHFGAVGGEIQQFDMLKVIGTSTCDIVIASYEDMQDKLIRGICGQVDGSVVPGYIGLEAGQSAFGDVYAWFSNIITQPVQALISESKLLDNNQKEGIKKEIADTILPHLNACIEHMPPSEHIISLDWINGRRTPDANQKLKGAISGLDMGTNVYQIYRSLVEATAFGARSIQERFTSEGIRIKRVVAVGGVARKSSVVMQILADVLNRTVYVNASDQACALGAAMFAAVAANIYPSVEAAQSRMGAGFDAEYTPRDSYVPLYDRLYKKYVALGSFVESHTEAMDTVSQE